MPTATQTAQQIRLRQIFSTFSTHKKRKPKRRGRIPKQHQPDAQRRSYLADIRVVLQSLSEMIRDKLVSQLPSLILENAAVRGDSVEREDAKRINKIMDDLSAQFFAQWDDDSLGKIARKAARATEVFQKKEFGKQLQAATGIDVLPFEPNLAPQVEYFTAENVALIGSIAERQLDDVTKLVIAGVREGKRAEELAKEIDDRTKVGDSNAQRIANDQIGKLFGTVNELRQTELGIDAYIWETSGDARVRPDHADRQGERFMWDDPPEDGHPGQPINCRCWASPDFSGILAEV